MVPAFTVWTAMPLRRALGTSLLVIAVLAMPGTIVHALLGNIDWAIFLVLTLGVVPGARIGASRSALANGSCASRSACSCSWSRSPTAARSSRPWPGAGVGWRDRSCDGSRRSSSAPRSCSARGVRTATARRSFPPSGSRCCRRRRGTAPPGRASPPRQSTWSCPARAGARAAVPRREPRDGAARRARDRGDAVLAGPDPQRLPGLARRDPSLVIDGGELRRTGGHDRAGRVARLRDLAHARSLGHRPRTLGRLSAQGRPAERPPSVAQLRTPVIFLVREPEVPLTLSWTFVLHHPITFAPDGTFTDPSLEVALGPGGRLNGEIRSLLELAADPELTAGRRRGLPGTAHPARTDARRLRRLEGGEVRRGGRGRGRCGARRAGARRPPADRRRPERRRLTALPSRRPSSPPSTAVGSAGTWTSSSSTAARSWPRCSGRTRPPDVLRPPGAALDDSPSEPPRRRHHHAAGRPRDGRAARAAARVRRPGDHRAREGTLSAIVPEPAADALLAATVEDDPVRASQVMLGELATIWQEQPGEDRGSPWCSARTRRSPARSSRRSPGTWPARRGSRPQGAVEFVAAYPAGRGPAARRPVVPPVRDVVRRVAEAGAAAHRDAAYDAAADEHLARPPRHDAAARGGPPVPGRSTPASSSSRGPQERAGRHEQPDPRDGALGHALVGVGRDPR